MAVGRCSRSSQRWRSTPSNPNILVAGSNDYIDQQPCPPGHRDARSPKCDDFSAGIGVSGVYFSFDRGETWTAADVLGWQARNCGTATAVSRSLSAQLAGGIPWYYEAGLVDDGDPAVAIGPKPG